jgi:hypothetical protein
VAQPGHDNGAAGRSERDGGATAVAGTVAVADTVRGGSAQQPDPGECSGGAKQTTRRRQALA